MGFFCCAHHHPLIFAIPLLILLISTFHVQGRKVAHNNNSQVVKEEKTMWRSQIGSRPPRCERQCTTCARCEAIQVPTNARIKNSRDEEANSNYKPMSWKCKCGNLIFNP